MSALAPTPRAERDESSPEAAADAAVAQLKRALARHGLALPVGPHRWLNHRGYQVELGWSRVATLAALATVLDRAEVEK